MPRMVIPRAEAEEANRLVQEHGSVKVAMRFTEWGESAFHRRLKAYKDLGDTSKVEIPSEILAGPEDEPIEDILNRHRQAYKRKKAKASNLEWFRIRVKETAPYALLWFGDPHLGPHCNWPLLEKHIAIANKPGVYGANIGDTTDAWPWTGRLAKLWAENDISHHTEKRLAEWFMFESGVPWLLWLLGNHDNWNNSDFYKRLGAHCVPVVDWRAKFVLEHNNGSVTRIDAAHGRKGNSIYNPTHGTLRAAKFGEDAHLFVTGHIHTFGLFDYEMPERKTRTWLAQCRGYKIFDDYALHNGFAEGQCGASILSVINPETGRVQCFSDPEEGYEFLAWSRQKSE